MATQTPQQPTAIKVSIKLDAGSGRVQIESSHPLPNVATLAAQFPAPKRALIKRAGHYNGLEYVIRSTSTSISYQEWSDVIASVISRQEENKSGATTESVVGAQSALILVGDTLYKMSPQKIVPPSKMVIEARKLIIQQAKDQSEHVVAASRLTANGIIRDATRQREEVEKQLAAARANSLRVPPIWAVENGLAVKYHDGRWRIRFKFNLRIRGFDVKYPNRVTGGETKFSWDALPSPAVAQLAWVPIYADGRYDVTSIRLDDLSKPIPHMSTGGACMTPADNPERISSMDSLQALAASVERCNSRVQMDSLYSGLAHWLDDFKAAVPLDLYAAINPRKDWTGAIRLAESHNPPVVNQREESKYQWSA